MDTSNSIDGYVLTYDQASGKYISKEASATPGDSHNNKDVLDKLSESGNELYFNGSKVDSASSGGTSTTSFRHKANADVPLRFDTYQESDLAFPNARYQTTHPSVKYFPSKFAGYYYWMAHTPYPNDEAYYENPTIHVSNDGVNWIHPDDFAPNPLDSVEKYGEFEYFSDTHLVYRDDTKTLECWYRKAISQPVSNQGEVIYRRTTKDGKTWTAPEELYRQMGNNGSVLSPAVIWDGSKYRIW